MFDKLKQLKQLRDLQNTIKKELHSGESNGVKITINGAFEMMSVEIANDLSKDEMAKAIKSAYQNAMGLAQSAAAKVLGGLMG